MHDAPHKIVLENYIVGTEGMIWVPRESQEYQYDENITIENVIEITNHMMLAS